MPTHEQLRAAIQPYHVCPAPRHIGTLRLTLREILLYVADDDYDRTRARLKSRARATNWNRPLIRGVQAGD